MSQSPHPVEASLGSPTRTGAPFFWLAAGVASWFASWGMQSVLFAWLIVGELHAEPERVGTAQMTVLLPSLLLLLVGGATADRIDRRRLLMALHAAAALVVAALALTVASGKFSFGILIAYALAMGTAQAFVLPARDAILSEVASGDMMRAVTVMTTVQFSVQALGALVGGSGRWIGTTAALCCQSAVLLAGVLPFSRLPRYRPAAGATGNPLALDHIRDGLREVWKTDRLRYPVLLASSNALLFLGPYVVCIPLMVRDFYHGDIGQLSLVNVMFPLGTIAGSLWLLSRGGIQRKGRAILIALFAAALFPISFGLGLPFWGLLLAVFAWGICGSVMFNASRTLVQQAAPPTHRARVLSIYSLALFGAGPIGALQAGLVAQYAGPFAACAISGTVMIVLVSAAWLWSPMPRMK